MRWVWWSLIYHVTESPKLCLLFLVVKLHKCLRWWGVSAMPHYDARGGGLVSEGIEVRCLF